MKKSAFITVENEVPVHVEHSELHHYTNWNGLSGIFNSGSLHATRFDCLNDWSEVIHFKESFINALQSEIKNELLIHRKRHLKLSQFLSKNGGAPEVAKKQATAWVDTLYEKTFSIKNTKHGFAIPFITSFCSHVNDHPYIQKNGLLSQWRGYGSGEKFALVFDSKKLNELTIDEAEEGYATIGTMDVVYNNELFDCVKRFPQLVGAAKSKCINDVWGEKTSGSDIETLFNTFTAASARFKHRGFEEEREVRIVAFLQRPEAITHLFNKHNRKIPALKYKATHMYGEIERIHLFEGRATKELPIKRIIIGPSKDQQTQIKKVRDLVGSKIDLYPSETPLI